MLTHKLLAGEFGSGFGRLTGLSVRSAVALMYEGAHCGSHAHRLKNNQDIAQCIFPCLRVLNESMSFG